MTTNDVRPVVAASQCLGFAAVRYNGAIIEDEFVQRLAQYVDIVQLCPEVGIGLGVPRDPIRMQMDGDGISLVQPATSRDITHLMADYAADLLGSLGPVDGFILKARSPSCGIADVSVFADSGTTVATTAPGRFADAVLRAHPDLPVTDELQLRDPSARAHFLTRIFTLARLRAAATGVRGATRGDGPHGGRRRDLVVFHSCNKYLLMAHHPLRMTELGRIVADAALSPTDAFAAYTVLLRDMLRTPPHAGRYANAMAHMYGYVSDAATAEERAAFVALNTTDRLAALQMLRTAIERDGNEYIRAQTCLQPFPQELT